MQAELLPLGDLPRGLLEGDDAPPGDEEADELLAEDPQGFVSLVLADLVIVLVDLPNQKAWLARLHHGRLLCPLLPMLLFSRKWWNIYAVAIL